MLVPKLLDCESYHSTARRMTEILSNSVQRSSIRQIDATHLAPERYSIQPTRKSGNRDDDYHSNPTNQPRPTLRRYHNPLQYAKTQSSSDTFEWVQKTQTNSTPTLSTPQLITAVRSEKLSQSTPLLKGTPLLNSMSIHSSKRRYSTRKT